MVDLSFFSLSTSSFFPSKKKKKTKPPTQLGLSPPLSSLDEESASLLLESYHSDPSWSAKGPARVQKPPPLVAGRLIIELFDDGGADKARENFRCICTGEKGISKGTKKPLHYKNVVFHRIVKGFVVQGGDVVRGDGSGAESIFGGKFKDEPAALKRKHDAVGVVGMANGGAKNGSACQFYITLAPGLNRLDGKHVVVGRVLLDDDDGGGGGSIEGGGGGGGVKGIDLLKRINDEAASESGEPRVRVAIGDCGEC